MTNDLPEVPENFAWEVKKPYYRNRNNYPASIQLIEHLEVGEWEELPEVSYYHMWGGHDREQYSKEFYDFAFQPKGWRKPPPLEPIDDVLQATHVRKNSKHVRQSAELTDRWDQEELVRVAADTLELYNIRTAQSEMYGTYPPKSL